jgi:hypothetical protein
MDPTRPVDGGDVDPQVAIGRGTRVDRRRKIERVGWGRGAVTRRQNTSLIHRAALALTACGGPPDDALWITSVDSRGPPITHFRAHS